MGRPRNVALALVSAGLAILAAIGVYEGGCNSFTKPERCGEVHALRVYTALIVLVAGYTSVSYLLRVIGEKNRAGLALAWTLGMVLFWFLFAFWVGRD